MAYRVNYATTYRRYRQKKKGCQAASAPAAPAAGKANAVLGDLDAGQKQRGQAMAINPNDRVLSSMDVEAAVQLLVAK